LLSDSEYRLHFLLHLNNARAAGKFCISKNTFIQLGQIMYRIVDFISTEKDFESMRYLLIMCQTYFFLNKQGEKFYLVRYIENHKLFQSNEFWEFYFSDSIFQEIEKQNKNEQPEHETKEENTKRFGNIVFSKLLSIAHNMMEFQIEKNQIQSLISVFSKQYNVDIHLETQIISMIEEIKYNQKKQFNENEDLTEDPLEQDIVVIEKNKNLKDIKPIITEDYFVFNGDGKEKDNTGNQNSKKDVEIINWNSDDEIKPKEVNEENNKQESQNENIKKEK
jgi:hypothetical protein